MRAEADRVNKVTQDYIIEHNRLQLESEISTVDRSALINAQENMDLQARERRELIDKLRDRHSDIQTDSKKADNQVKALSVQIENVNVEKIEIKSKVEHLNNQIMHQKNQKIMLDMQELVGTGLRDI